MNAAVGRNLSTQPLTTAEFARAAQTIYQWITPTPQIAWPMLAARSGCEVWVKHENHLPTGAFKVRGGLWFMHELAATNAAPNGVICATRGNHGQSIAHAARVHGVTATIVVPYGNNPEKNRAMSALGAELIEHGADFNEALDHATELAAVRGLFPVPSFDPLLVQGVGTYAYEFLRAVPDLDCVYVPIGLGSGIAGMVAARNALGHAAEIVGVVATKADAYAQSFAARKVVTTATAATLADGLAVRVPAATALEYMLTGVARIVRVDDDEILRAIGAYYVDTHNLAEGAGAAPLAALLQERERMRGRRVGLILSGANLDRPSLLQALALFSSAEPDRPDTHS